MLHSKICVLHKLSNLDLIHLKECPLDHGGYFVIRGVERALLMQECPVRNRMIFTIDAGLPVVSVFSSAGKKSSKTVLLFKNDCIFLQLNCFCEDLPIAIVFKAIGIESEKQIVHMVTGNSYHGALLVPSFVLCKKLGIVTTQNALTWLKERKRYRYSANTSDTNETLKLLTGSIFEHVPANRYGASEKVFYLAYMVQKMLQFKYDPSYYHEQVEDMDSYSSKRINLPGELLLNSFDDLFEKMRSDVDQQVVSLLSKKTRRSEVDVSRFVRHETVTYGLEFAIKSGNWKIKGYHTTFVGLTERLNRTSFLSSLGLMTRVNFGKTKLHAASKARGLHPSHWGVLCPCDTPEGESCGLVKNLSLNSHVTLETSEQDVLRLLFILGLRRFNDINSCSVDKFAVVILNGLIVGVQSFAMRSVKYLRTCRRIGLINRFVSISILRKTLVIDCDGGRLCRPLIICDGGAPRLTMSLVESMRKGEISLDELSNTGVLEYLDRNEEKNALVALSHAKGNSLTTHIEIEPFSMTGIVTGMIPYLQHNHSPRNTYQCAMGKQAVGNIAFNQLLRLDQSLHLLCYPQKPLLSTAVAEITGFDKLGCGQNATVCIMSLTGYDIEDAIVVNKSALERGLGSSVLYEKFSTTLKRYPNRTSDKLIELTDHRLKTRPAYKLDCDGLVMPGEVLQCGDVYLCKKVPLNTKKFVNSSHMASKSFYHIVPQFLEKTHQHEKYSVGKVLLTTCETEDILIRILLRRRRVPILGDKLSSRHGQKGTLGELAQQENLPFSERGICADLIMNPHGFPSRMTVGKLIELIGAKAASLSGNFFFGTAFDTFDGSKNIHAFSTNGLVDVGFAYSGKDFVMCGQSGSPKESLVFMGPINYQRLKHMVYDKIYGRSRGPRVELIKQPTEGRSRKGGLRIGEMERDCLISYGCAHLICERLMISSDHCSVNICSYCGVLAAWNPALECNLCPLCKQTNKVTKIRLPHAFKLLLQELEAVNIFPGLRINTNKT
eukprot:gnl/MRDRNA2_/MRDRNA2_86795_c0_seq6.p1 gnl/MRDRNA2_/MRDRNA2_86795_c0~~gnl/MRDRNA2_/MRDRNA2_86795_c0_seq6.p1  ORF type:complete len:1004 (+),score=-29.39 gnl/MRDRNA2_/MRDRNA2_86795_c0_seq6:393-3404(+)